MGSQSFCMFKDISHMCVMWSYVHKCLRFIISFYVQMINYEGLGLWCLMLLSTIFHLYCGGQFYQWRKIGENHRPSVSHWLHR